MRILVAVLIILVMGMGYTTYVTWHKGQTQAVVTEASEDEKNGLRKDNSRLIEENNHLKSVNTKIKGQLTTIQGESDSLRQMVDMVRKTPVVGPPQRAEPFLKR